jgi:hypothetical protein
MKRCLIPGILALGIHGLLFAMEFNWPTGESFFHPKTPVVTMTLTYLQSKSKPTVQKTTPAPKKVIKKVKIATLESKPILKPKPDFILPPKLKLDPNILKTPELEPRPEKIETRFEQKPAQIPLDTFEPSTPVVFTRSPAPRAQTEVSRSGDS